MNRLFSVIALSASMLFFGANAQAMVIGFGGGATGTDPLGNPWQTTTISSAAGAGSWGEPGLGAGSFGFNPNGYSLPDSNTSASALSFIYLNGVTGPITNLSTTCGGFSTATRFCDETTGVAFIPTLEDGGREVVFNAPAGQKISEGDSFYVNVVFAGDVDPTAFSFAGEWADTPLGAIPEPASLALLGSSFLGLAFLRRRKRG